MPASRHFLFFDGSGATVASERLAPTNMYKLMRALLEYQPRATFHNTPEIVHISKEHDQAIREICQRSGTVNSRDERLSQSNGRAVNDA